MTESFAQLVKDDASYEDIRQHLEALPASERVKQVLGFPAGLQGKLFEACKGQGDISMAEFVPASEETIIYELKNSLMMFNISQKRFFRPNSGEVVGYNRTGGFATFFTGPGYFYAVDGDDGEVVFDYTRLPDLQPDGWPKILENRGCLRGVTYGNQIDYVRRISKDTVIGTAYQNGKPRNAYFLLTASAAEG